MKVCTDACLFGAWSAAKMNEYLPGCDFILDVGSGTGLLSLMLAQKTAAQIDAVEMDASATKQSDSNFAASPWAERLHVVQSPIGHFIPGKKYDLIISNPPFYKNSLTSPDKGRAAAMHDSELSLDELVHVFIKHVSIGGYAAVLLPFTRSGYFENMAAGNGLYVIEKLNVRQTNAHTFFRTMLWLSKEKKTEIIEREIAIHDQNREYSPAFETLLKDYYLDV